MNNALSVWAWMLLLVGTLLPGLALPADTNQGSLNDQLVDLLIASDDPDFQRDILVGMRQALTGQKNIRRPAKWSKAFDKLQQSKDASVQENAMMLGLLFGDPKAEQTLRHRVDDRQADAKLRSAALQALAERKDPKLPAMLLTLVTDAKLGPQAVRALSRYQQPQTPEVLIKNYSKMTLEARLNAVATLASRRQWASALVDAVENKKIPTSDVSTFTVRQLMQLGDQNLNKKLIAQWGQIRPTSQDKAKLLAKYRKMLNRGRLNEADVSRGRLVYKKTCASCHQLFDDGRAVGPNLTGSQRANLDYILENVLDPNAVIGKDYQMTTLALADGRVVSGLIKEENKRTLKVLTQNDELNIDKDDVEERQLSKISMMPEGQLDKLSASDIRDLVAYLASPTQVPLPMNTNELDSN